MISREPSSKIRVESHAVCAAFTWIKTTTIGEWPLLGSSPRRLPEHHPFLDHTSNLTSVPSLVSTSFELDFIPTNNYLYDFLVSIRIAYQCDSEGPALSKTFNASLELTNDALNSSRPAVASRTPQPPRPRLDDAGIHNRLDWENFSISTC